MSDQGLPVTVAVTRPDGSVEHVRVGTAFRNGEGFTLRLSEMSIGGAPSRGGGDYGGRKAASSGSYGGGGGASYGGGGGSYGGGGGGGVFPNYGRSKGAPIQGATMQDLEYYAAGARRTLDDPSKSRWHDKERALLAAIEAEIARQRGGGGGESDGGGDEPPPHSDEDAPF
jgi:hypothetical protein